MATGSQRTIYKKGKMIFRLLRIYIEIEIENESAYEKKPRNIPL